MGTTTVNTFPSLHALDSPRGWILALIVLLHVAFVWALNSSLSFSKIFLPPPKTTVVVIDERPPTPPPRQPTSNPTVTPQEIYVPLPPTPQEAYPSDEQIFNTTTTQPPSWPTRTEAPLRPTIVEPAIPRSGLSEPLYPASAIRAGHAGTVLLSVQVLENGRVGEVRLLQSSGHAKLDESALREARKWRFVPGTRDGVPVVLWKEIPITFEIQEHR